MDPLTIPPGLVGKWQASDFRLTWLGAGAYNAR